MQGGFKLKGRVPGGEMDIAPGEFVDLDATVDDVKKAVMPLPFKEPSSTLFQLLGFIVDAGQRLLATQRIKPQSAQLLRCLSKVQRSSAQFTKDFMSLRAMNSRSWSV